MSQISAILSESCEQHMLGGCCSNIAINTELPEFGINDTRMMREKFEHSDAVKRSNKNHISDVDMSDVWNSVYPEYSKYAEYTKYPPK